MIIILTEIEVAGIQIAQKLQNDRIKPEERR
jgi:hypothetical protein